MIQNIYDDAEFFEGYKKLRDTGTGLNDVLEQPAFRALLPPLGGLNVLDIGCGMGHLAAYISDEGAEHVLGLDVSERMLEIARRDYGDRSGIEFVQSPMETAAFPDGAFDLVVSSLALHYIDDYASLVTRVHAWLKPGGYFVYSVEHPIATSQVLSQGWIKDETGNILHWPVDNYATEGKREQKWFVHGVVKYHRRLSTLLNTLIEAGFTIEQTDEPEAIPEALEERPDLVNQSRCPPFLLVRARRGVSAFPQLKLRSSYCGKSFGLGVEIRNIMLNLYSSRP